MDRDIDPATLRARRLRRAAVAFAVLAAVALLLGVAPRWLTPSLRRNQFRTAVVDLGALQTAVEASGTVVPLVERAVSSPVDARITRIKARPGDTVRRGDELLELDTSATRLELERLIDRLAQKESELKRVALQQERDARELRGQLESRRLDLDLAESRLRQYGRLHDEGLASADTLQQAEVTARKTRIEAEQLADAVDVAGRTSAAERDALALDVLILRKEADEARHRLELATARAETDGVVTFLATTEGTTVRSGEVLARLADLSAFRIEATVSDIHAGKLAPGQAVRVLLPGEPLAGRIAAIHPAIENGVVRFTAVLDDPGDRRLRHNLRTDVVVVTGTRENVLRLASGPSVRAGSTMPVFVVRGDLAERRTARFGASGDQQVEVLSGLAAGDEVIVSSVEDYLHAAQIRIH